MSFVAIIDTSNFINSTSTTHMTTDPTSPVFDFEAYLKSDELASMYNSIKRGRVTWQVMGSLSAIASISIITHILRSHHGLSTTYHRLVFGLSVADVIYSFFSFLLNNIMLPKEIDYLIPGAIGSQATCNAQGFLTTFGLQLSLCYNNSICFYYLAIVTFNKKDDFIRKKLEPCLHGITILIPLIANMIAAFSGGHCLYGRNGDVPHCSGLESGEIRNGFTIPCGREDGEENPTITWVQKYLTLCIIIVSFVFIVVTMALMYWTVHKLDKKIQQYGTGALRLRTKAANNYVGNIHGNLSTNNSPNGFPAAPHDGKISGNHSRLALIQCLKTKLSKVPCIDTCCSSGHKRPRSNKLASQKRAILNSAIGYIIAWCLSWIPGGILFFGRSGATANFVQVLFSIFHPLQGVYNFIAYMLPKVRNAKKVPTRRKRVRAQGGANQVNDISWGQAFAKACMSRGPKMTSGQHHARSNINNGNSWGNNILNAWKKLKARVSTTVRNKSTAGSNDEEALATEQQQQQIRPPAPSSGQGENIIGILDAPPLAQGDNVDESPVAPSPTLQSNSYGSSPPLVLTEDAGDLKGGGGEEEVYPLNSSNENFEKMSSDLGEGPNDI